MVLKRFQKWLTSDNVLKKTISIKVNALSALVNSIIPELHHYAPTASVLSVLSISSKQLEMMKQLALTADARSLSLSSLELTRTLTLMIWLSLGGTMEIMLAPEVSLI